MRAFARSRENEAVKPPKWKRLLKLVWSNPETGGLEIFNRYLEATQAARPVPTPREQEASTRAGRLLWS